MGLSRIPSFDLTLSRQHILFCPIMAQYSGIISDPACVRRSLFLPFISDPLK